MSSAISRSLSRETSSSSASECYFIGIDFGTTYTKVSWAFSKKSHDIRVIQAWPASGSTSKVPSTIQYQNNGRFTWGYEASPEDPNTLQWFKLLLVNDKKLGNDILACDYMTNAASALRAAHRVPQDVVKDYLSAIWKHTIDNICKQQRRSIVELFPFRVILTVPSTWAKHPDAINRLNEAAKQAGILDVRDAGKTELDFVAEPEAAALATLEDSRDIGEIMKGDIWIICDAGGGTVDLVTYEMEDSQRIQVRECVESDGGACGSLFLDQEMEVCMQRWLGRRWTGLSEEEKRKFGQKWEANKCLFEGHEQQALTAEIGKSSKRDFRPFGKSKSGLQVDKGLVKFERDNMAMIFSKVVKQVINLVGNQIREAKKVGKTPKLLVLVGGLGGSRYLYHQLKAAYSWLEIIQRDDEKPLTAVCRGAVYKAMSLNIALNPPTGDLERLPPEVTHRVALLSYGVSFFEPFDPNIHDEEDKDYDEAGKKHIATNLMYWYIHRGETIATFDPRPTYTFRNNIRAPLPGNRFVVQIWKCDSLDPPKSRRGRDDVIRCTQVSCTMDVSFDQLPRCENPLYREIMFQLDLVPNGPRLEFVAMMNGVVRGRTDLKLNYA